MSSVWNPRPFAELRNVEAGNDIWLIASGKSLDYVEPAFFDNKVAVALNRAYIRFRTKYMMSRDNNFFEEMYQESARRGAVMIAAREGSRADRPHEMFTNRPEQANGHPVYQFENAVHEFDIDVVGSDTETIGGLSSITPAMNVCAHLGAANIILCGADAGMLDGLRNFAGYREGTTPGLETDERYINWLKAVERQVSIMRSRIWHVYGCRVVSLNPFLNFNLEGHSYVHG